MLEFILPYTVSFKTGRYTEKLVVKDSSPSQLMVLCGTSQQTRKSQNLLFLVEKAALACYAGQGQ
jgi:hypothetical protein